jgi:N-acetyl-1-D-myo-inositol-2-amino-2-deoxy-alpha-D-glucopyranoside deacetylase
MGRLKDTLINPPVLLAVLAHPDDETFGMGGTLALYAQRGIKVHLICATRGEAGEIDPEYLEGFQTKAEVRESELRCASGLLGLAGVHFLNYRDSGMTGSPENKHPDALVNAPVDKVAADITHYIRKLRPDVVITFDPIGGYRHPDHLAIHFATVKAFFAAGKTNEYPDGLPAHLPQRLFFQTMPHNLMRFAVRMMPLFGVDPRRFGRNKDIDLIDIVSVRFPIHAVIRYGEVAAIRDQATACHASQGGMQFFRGPFGWLRRTLSTQETFMQAYPEPQYRRPINDLFAGIKEHSTFVTQQSEIVHPS